MFEQQQNSAERVADERCEDVGTTVGYNVRLQSSVSSSTQLLFLTPGNKCSLKDNIFWYD